MRKKFFIVSVILLIIVFIYQIKNVSTIDEVGSENFVFKNEVVDKSESTVYEDEYADDAFKSVYQLDNLIDHEVYRYNDTIYVDLFFDENVSRAEISNSRTYILKLFVKKSEMKMTRIPYVKILYDDMSWKNVRLNIFVNDTIILQEKFANIDNWLKGNLIIDYYENSEIELSSRIMENESFDNFSRYIKFRFWGIHSVILEKSYKGNFIFVKLKGNKQYANKKIIKIKELTESKLIADLTTSFKDKPIGFDNSGIVFQMYDDDNKYYEMTYIFQNEIT